VTPGRVAPVAHADDGGALIQEDIMTEMPGQLSWREERVLLYELNHRINNEFAAAIGIVSLAAARSGNENVKTALTAVTELLHNYAHVHRALQVPEHDTLFDAAAYVRELCVAISRSQLDYRKINVVLATEPLWLKADRCWRLGMIVYELISNAARHAFREREGAIRIELEGIGAFVKCSVLDNGSSDVSVAPGRGLKIIRELTESLGGQLDQKFGPNGSSSILVFPCATAAERSPTKSVQPEITQVAEEIPIADERSHAIRFRACG
jgi:two-component sensor histidine kinase